MRIYLAALSYLWRCLSETMVQAHDLFRVDNLYKLSTKEGANHYHIHRYLGTLVLANYLYRVYLRYKTGNPFPHGEGSLEVLAVTVLHATLSCSSLLFHIPQKRNAAHPMIWPEFRLHNILFGCRSFVAMLWVVLLTRLGVGVNTPVAKAGRVAVVFANLLLADKVSHYYKTIGKVAGDDSTMRGMPYPPDWSLRTQELFQHYYAALQFIATAAIMLNATQYTLLLSAFPVQFAALLMTCVRKGIVTAKGWHLWYAITMMLALCSTFNNPFAIVENLFLGGLLYSIRAVLRVDKYLLWGVLAMTLPLVINAPDFNPFLELGAQSLGG